MLSVVMQSIVMLSVVMLSVVMLSVVMLSVIMLSVTNKPILLSVVAPAKALHYTRVKILPSDKTL